MKFLRNKNINTFKDQKGVVIIEATIVFPVMFFVLFFLIYFGNVFYEKSQIDSFVTEYAILGSQYCSDPLLSQIKANNGVVPDEIDVQPYRYLFGGMSDIEKSIADGLTNSINGESSFFKNMQPVIKTTGGKIASFNNYVLYSTFSVDVKYQITFPIRFLGENTPKVITASSRAEIPIGDCAEFIRNTDMAIDFIEDTIVGEKIAGVFGKINSFIEEFAGK